MRALGLMVVGFLCISLSSGKLTFNQFKLMAVKSNVEEEVTALSCKDDIDYHKFFFKYGLTQTTQPAIIRLWKNRKDDQGVIFEYDLDNQDFKYYGDLRSNNVKVVFDKSSMEGHILLMDTFGSAAYDYIGSYEMSIVSKNPTEEVLSDVLNLCQAIECNQESGVLIKDLDLWTRDSNGAPDQIVNGFAMDSNGHALRFTFVRGCDVITSAQVFKGTKEIASVEPNGEPTFNAPLTDANADFGIGSNDFHNFALLVMLDAKDNMVDTYKGTYKVRINIQGGDPVEKTIRVSRTFGRVSDVVKSMSLKQVFSNGTEEPNVDEFSCGGGITKHTFNFNFALPQDTTLAAFRVMRNGQPIATLTETMQGDEVVQTVTWGDWWLNDDNAALSVGNGKKTATLQLMGARGDAAVDYAGEYTFGVQTSEGNYFYVYDNPKALCETSTDCKQGNGGLHIERMEMWSYGDSGVDDEEDLMSVKGFDCGGDGHKLYFWFKKGCGKLQEVKVLLNNTLIAWKNMTVLAGLSPDYVLSVDPEFYEPLNDVNADLWVGFKEHMMWGELKMASAKGNARNQYTGKYKVEITSDRGSKPVFKQLDASSLTCYDFNGGSHAGLSLVAIIFMLFATTLISN